MYVYLSMAGKHRVIILQMDVIEVWKMKCMGRVESNLVCAPHTRFGLRVLRLLTLKLLQAVVSLRGPIHSAGGIKGAIQASRKLFIEPGTFPSSQAKASEIWPVQAKPGSGVSL